MLKIPGASGAIVKCVNNSDGYEDDLVVGENYFVISVEIHGDSCYLSVMRDGKVVPGCQSQRFINLEKLK